jgi:hypothetical protein
MTIWRQIRRLPEIRGWGSEWWFQQTERRNEYINRNNKKKKTLTKGVSFGPQMRASQVKKSDSEIGPRCEIRLKKVRRITCDGDISSLEKLASYRL